MKDFVKWMDNCPLVLKIIFALPGLDLVWAIYRVVKGVAYHKTDLVIAGILWIVFGWIALWLIDLISIIIYKEPKICV